MSDQVRDDVQNLCDTEMLQSHDNGSRCWNHTSRFIIN